MTTPRPAYDVELEAALALLNLPVGEGFTLESIRASRATIPLTDPATVIGDRPIEHVDYTVPGPDGEPDITLAVFRRADHTTPGAAIYVTHGGGMIGGDRFGLSDDELDWIERFDLVLVSVEYRLAPEHPDPAPVEDCYAGLVWTAANAGELGFDPARLLISGGSAGGGLAAGTALLARDRGGPALAGQMLICPMLDDRDATTSTHQFDGRGLWHRDDNIVGWTALLGDRKGGSDVSIYAAPARATDLSGLPPAFIDVGSAEVFRDEDVAYASGIWAAGGIAELHVWPGGFHGFDYFAPTAAVSQASRGARESWVRRTLGL
jgi:acetyl esterase/lipase